jgi:FAD/FMN-containing dehydrogenase
VTGDLRERFEAAVSSDRVVTDPEALASYGADITENPPAKPDLAVCPVTAEQVQDVVRIAAEARVPLTPAVARMNVGGLAIPAEGGVVVDLSDMDRIVELNRADMYAIVEPGVTFGQMRAALDARAPDLTMSYPLSPPHTSVAANFLLDGLGSLSLPYGSHGEQIGGLEAVLSDGTLIKAGACATSDVWFGRGPLPDLVGAFVNWQGTSGIVPKLAVQLWPKPRHSKRLFVFVGDLAGCFALVRDLSRASLCSDLSAITWPLGKMVFGVDAPRSRDPGEPEVFVYLDVGADDKLGLRYKERAVRRILSRHERSGLEVHGVLSIDELIEATPSLGRFAEFPMTLDFLLDHPGGGLTWVGTYGPVSRWEEGATAWRDLMEERGVPPLLVTRPMKGAHFGVLRAITCFDRADPGEIEKVRALNLELLTRGLELGFVPYKAPDWAVRELAARADPGYRELFERLRNALDPARIMNPARLPLGRSGEDTRIGRG